LLREQCHVSRVVAFGSLTREESFTRWSDVDIAAWGIAPEDTFRAIGAVMDLGTEIPVNLVDVNTARPSLLTVIEPDGVEL
jgi:predicted nucleotidyltransferase